MSTRLQVVLDETELREIQRAARRDRLTVSEWVRRCLREARRRQPVRDADRKVQAIRAAVRHEFPTADVERMLAEIESSYLGGPVGAVIFVDSNVPMYLVGAPHPHKADSQRPLERCVAEQERLVTDAEVHPGDPALLCGDRPTRRDRACVRGPPVRG